MPSHVSTYSELQTALLLHSAGDSSGLHLESDLYPTHSSPVPLDTKPHRRRPSHSYVEIPYIAPCGGGSTPEKQRSKTTVSWSSTESIKPIPAPRLVGIELNPGPVPSPSDIARAVRSALTAAVNSKGVQSLGSKKQRKRKGKKSKRGPPNVNITGGPSRHIGAEMRDIPQKHPPPPGQFKNITNSKRHVHLLDFDCPSMKICSNSSGVLVVGSTVSTFKNIEIDPNASLAGIAIFGSAIFNVASNFTKWRLHDLRVSYEPMCASSTTGGLAFSYTGDGAADISSTYSISTLTSFDGAIITPPWQKARVGTATLDKGWRYVIDPTTQGASEKRLDHAGAILCASAVALPISTEFGFLKFTGTIEFSGLGVQSAPALERLHAAHAVAYPNLSPPAPACSSSSAPPIQPPFCAPTAPDHVRDSSQPIYQNIDGRWALVTDEDSMVHVTRKCQG